MVKSAKYQSFMNFFKRREKLRERLKEESVDAFLTFYPPHLFYLTGFEGEGAFLLLKGEGFLFTDYRYLPQKIGEEEWKFVGVEKDLLSTLKEKVKELKISKIAFEENHISVKMRKELNKFRKIKWKGTSGWVEEERMCKDKDELNRIFEAVKIAQDVMEEVPSYLNECLSERDLAIEIEYLLRKKGSDTLPFPPIVASGESSSLPHARPQKNIIEKGPLIVDIGAKVEGYCSDITFTFFLGSQSRKWKERENLIDEAIEKAISLIEPGKEVREVFHQISSFFHKNRVRENFLHALGHGVGIEVHERPYLSWKEKEKFRVGMVFTLEPGLYFPGEGGIRKEIMVYINEKGKPVKIWEEKNGVCGY